MQQAWHMAQTREMFKKEKGVKSKKIKI